MNIYIKTITIGGHLFVCTCTRMLFISIGKPEANEVPLTDGVDWDAEDDVLSGMTSIAICGIEDPVRPEVSM